MKVILSLGGSLIVPEAVDENFLIKLKSFLKELLSKGHKIGIICGGGSTARKYTNSNLELSPIQKDNLGISATRLNALLVSYVLSDLKADKIFTNTSIMAKAFGKKIVISGGTVPGHTTDYIAGELAKKVKADAVINLTNVDGVYDKDPRKFTDAEKFEKMTWKEFFDFFKIEFNPGMNFAFDPVAAKLCQKNKIKVIIMKGTDFDNLKNFFDGKKFIGTILE